MKYVKSRDNFLTGITEYKETDNLKGLELIQEDGGPLHNAVEFGDSWVGRWIHNIMRVAKEKADKLRIAGQIRRLKSALDRIIEYDTPTKMLVIKTTEGGEGGEGGGGDPIKGEDTYSKFLKLQLHTFLDELNAGVEKGHKVSILKGLTDFSIENIEGIDDFEAKTKDGVDCGKKALLEQLKAFREFLKKFKDDEGKDDPEFKVEKAPDDEDEEGDKEDEEKGGDDESKKLFTMIESLKYLALIIETYKRVKIEAKATQKEVYTYITKPGDTIEKIQKSPEINKNKLQIKDIRSKNEKTLKNYAKDNQTLAPNLKLVMENVEVLFEDEDCFYIINGEDYIILEKETFGTGGSADRQTIKTSNQKGEPLKQGEDHLTQAFAKLKKDIEVLESEKEKGIGISSKFINDIVASYKEPENRATIKSLYFEINRYLVGDKKSTIQEKDALYKENVDVIKNLSKRVLVAEKIARFTKRAIQFDGENLYGGLGDLGKNLKGYVESMKKIMAYKLSDNKSSAKFKVGDLVTWKSKEGKTITKNIEKVEGGKYFFKKENGEEYSKSEDSLTKAKEEPKKEEVKKESRLLRYNSYFHLITEADDENKEEKKEEGGDVSETSKKIIEYWKTDPDEKKSLSAKVGVYILVEDEYNKLWKELESSEEDFDKSPPTVDIKVKDPEKKTVKREKVTLKGLIFTIDPVLDIVKAFNKAYKLHTTEVIPSGRTTGAVSNRIFRQYTSLGGGSPDSAGKQGGPYRNNAVFNKWEEAVLDVLAERKYQKIFLQDTKLLVGDELIPNAGANLRKFMTDLLDGDKLYKGGDRGGDGQGAQARFLDQYFNYKGDGKDLYDGAQKEQVETQKVAAEVDKKNTEQVTSFTKDNISYTQVDELKGTMFKVEDSDTSYYFFIQDVKGTDFLVTYTQGFKFYHDIIRQQGTYAFPTLSQIKGDSSKTPSDSYKIDGGEYLIKATKIPTRYFNTKTGKIEPGKYTSTYIKKKVDEGKPHSNIGKNVEKSSKTDTINIKSEKTFILSNKPDKNDKESKFLKITNFDSLKEKGVFPNIRDTAGLSDNDVKISK